MANTNTGKNKNSGKNSSQGKGQGTNATNAATNAAVDANFDQTVEVLYQKMGDRWFAFSVIDEEIFVGSVSQSEIDAGSPGAAKVGKA